MYPKMTRNLSCFNFLNQYNISKELKIQKKMAMFNKGEIDRIRSDPQYANQLVQHAMAQHKPPHSYRNYDTERENMMNDKVWFSLANSKYIPQFEPLSEHYQVPIPTLKYWRKQLIKNGDWIPNKRTKSTSVHSCTRKGNCRKDY